MTEVYRVSVALRLKLVRGRGRGEGDGVGMDGDGRGMWVAQGIRIVWDSVIVYHDLSTY